MQFTQSFANIFEIETYELAAVPVQDIEQNKSTDFIFEA